MEAFLNKKYKLISSENFEEVMKALGVGLLTRKMGNTTYPTVELTEKDGKYTLSTVSLVKSTIFSFEPGKEFDEETADGRKVKSVCTFEGNVMKQLQTGPDGKVCTIIREFTPEEIKTLVEFEGIKSTRLYKVQQ